MRGLKGSVYDGGTTLAAPHSLARQNPARQPGGEKRGGNRPASCFGESCGGGVEAGEAAGRPRFVAAASRPQGEMVRERWIVSVGSQWRWRVA